MPVPYDWRTLRKHQRDILLDLYKRDGLSGAELNDRLSTDDGMPQPPTTYRNLEGLRDRGLVEADPGMGRNNTIYITDAGRKLVDAVKAYLSENDG